MQMVVFSKRHRRSQRVSKSAADPTFARILRGPGNLAVDTPKTDSWSCERRSRLVDMRCGHRLQSVDVSRT
jgi:hypothetical protein